MEVADTVFQSAFAFAATCAVLALAQVVYVLLGFGSGLIAVGCLALVLTDIRDVVVVLLLVNVPAELYIVWNAIKDKSISWRGVLALCAGLAVGVPVGTFVLQRSRPESILLVLGALLVVVGVAFLLAPERHAVRWPAWVAPPVGLVAGVLAGTFGTGAPPLILYYQLGGIRKQAFRANLMTIFLLIAMVRIPSYAVGGLLTTPRLWSALFVLPAVLLGAWLGHRIHLQLSEKAFRRVVSAALVLLGGLQLVQRIG